MSEAKAAREIVFRADIDLRYYPDVLEDRALEALAERDALGFLALAENDYSTEIVFFNQAVLKELGIFEEAFAVAVVAPRLNNHRDYRLLNDMVPRLDRERLRTAGDPLPGTEPWTIYRGVAGRGKARRIRGYSWTGGLERAAWFANRAAETFGLDDPAVFCATVREPEILFYSSDRQEEEFFVDLPSDYAVKRVRRLLAAAAELEG